MTNELKTNKATHRGSCQACGRVQAIEPFKHVLAKHGYTVEWGFFNGICAGADHMPLEQDHALTDAIIKQLREEVAPAADQRAADLRSGKIEPKFFKMQIVAGKRENIEVKRDELHPLDAQRFIDSAVYRAEQNAAQARSHATMLEKLIVARFGQPLQPVKIEKKELLKVGSRVLIGGKKGDIQTVVKLDYKVCSGCGPYMNGRSMLHAFFARDNGSLWAMPARSIRASAIVGGAA